ncbi:unnamed protein product [Pleuronectes platessa]|uniref:Uncharacterized protein n=1 Tax=Pleuronectes platessa TaxID=8262 RepID=A0A9N7UWD0_PLEPL|nr:unnamed protein product [Pleuronectes platessa]
MCSSSPRTALGCESVDVEMRHRQVAEQPPRSQKQILPHLSLFCLRASHRHVSSHPAGLRLTTLIFSLESLRPERRELKTSVPQCCGGRGGGELHPQGPRAEGDGDIAPTRRGWGGLASVNFPYTSPRVPPPRPISQRQLGLHRGHAGSPFTPFSAVAAAAAQ